jgi:acetolactate synthase I/III small subunit
MTKSKSAYSTPSKVGKLDTHIIVVWVDNETGVLARVVGLFSGRGYNIESLAVAEIDSKTNLSRITIVTTGTPQVIDQIKLQLMKLVPVHKVADFKRENKNVIFKEMALLKIVENSAKIKKALKACKKFDPVILDKTKKSVVVQITALRRDIDKMTKNLKPLGLVSVSRTGAVAMTRGAEVFNN